MRMAFVIVLASLAACGGRSELKAPPHPPLPDVVDVPVDTPRDIVDVPRDVPTDVTPRVDVTCPAPLQSTQTSTVTLVGMANSNVGLPLSYNWSVTRAPTDSTAQPMPADAAITMFTFDTGGDWILTFRATDTAGNVGSCTVHLFADPAIDLLCPNDQSNYQGATVTMTATASSRFGRSLTYAWSVDSRPPASMTSPTPTDQPVSHLLLDALGDWHLRLRVTDSMGVSRSCLINVHADPDVIVTCPDNISSHPFATVDLAATAMSRLGLPLTYHWEIVDSPITSTASIPSPTMLATPFTFDVAGTWLFRFTATNSRGNSASCTTHAIAASNEAVRVELVWNTDRSCGGCNPQGGGIDLDLHLADTSRAMGHWDGNAPMDSDCYYANCNCGMGGGGICPHGVLDWAPAGDVDNPQLDVDHISDLPGPENINMLQAQNGSQFDVGVHFFSGHGDAQFTPAVVRIYCAGTVVFESEPVRIGPDTGDPSTNPLWHVGTITMTPGGCTFSRCGSPGNVAMCIRAENAW